MNPKRDLDLAVALLGPQLRDHVRSLELVAEDPGERLAALVSLADRARSWCVVHHQAHEIRSPLNGLALTAQVLAGALQGADRSAAGLVATILRDVGRVAAGLEELVETVRTEPEQLTRVDLAELVRGLLALVSPALEGTDLRLELTPTALEVDVRCDAAWTRHALVHVLLDAQARSSQVTLRVEASGNEGRILVEDAGPPAPPISRRDRFSDIAQPLILAQGGRLDRRANAAGTRVELCLERWQHAS